MLALDAQFTQSQLARVLEVSLSGYAAHRRKDQGRRRQADEQIKGLLQSSFLDSRDTYGRPRLQVCLRQAGYRCGANRLSRLMHQLGLRPKQKRRFRPQTTQSDPTQRPAPNWLAKVPAPSAPNQVWVSDITALPTGQGWLYLAATLDACTRRCVGYSLEDSLETHLVTQAWERACRNRRPAPGLLHHSDRGVQYTSSRFAQLLRQAGATASMSRRANPYDNALMESFFATLKTECLGKPLPLTRAQAKLQVFDYIETFYNPRRLHSALGYRSPLDFERQFC